MFESEIKMKIRLDQEKMKIELEARFFPLMQSPYEFPLSLDIQGQLMGAKRSKSGKNRFQEGFLKTFFPNKLPLSLRGWISTVA